jgi:hypothetical protein
MFYSGKSRKFDKSSQGARVNDIHMMVSAESDNSVDLLIGTKIWLKRECSVLKISVDE